MQSTPQFYSPPLTLTNKILLGLTVGFFILAQMLPEIGSYLSLNLNFYRSFFIFQFFTHPLVHFSLMSVIFEGLLLWFIGGDIERLLGRKNYWLFLFCTVLFSSLAFLVTNFFMGEIGQFFGLTSIGYGLLLAYAVHYPDRPLSFMLIFPMKAKYFCAVLAAIQLYMSVFSGQKAIALAHLFGALGAGFYLYFLRSKQKQGNLMKKFKQKQREHLKSQLKLIKNDDKDNTPKYWN